jgi:hypothetical protein
LEGEIHQGTPSKRKLFGKSIQHHERQLLQEVGTKATGPRRIFAKTLTHMKNAAEEEAYRAVNMIADKSVRLQVCLFDAKIEATTWSIADTDHIANHLETEIDSITSKAPSQFTKEFCIGLVKFAAWSQAIGIQELQQTIEQHVIHFGYSKLHLVSHLSEPLK